MTDKQIINGVDVSWCIHSNDNNNDECNITGMLCKHYSNCYYKQLKRKEQECEEYKKKLDNIQDSCPASVDCSYRQCDKDRIAELKKELSSLLAEKNALEIGRDEYKQECQLLKQALKNQNIVAIVEENDQLKAENEELKETNSKLQKALNDENTVFMREHIWELKAENEELKARIKGLKKEIEEQREYTRQQQKLIYCAGYDKDCLTGNDCKQKVCVFKSNLNYKQALDEIEEVCRNGAYDEFKMPLDENSIILDIINKADCRQSAESFCVAKHADTFNADNQAVKDGE